MRQVKEKYETLYKISNYCYNNHGLDRAAIVLIISRHKAFNLYTQILPKLWIA